MPPQTLVAALRDRKVIPFVGAGLSVGVGLPDWGTLIELLAARLDAENLAAEATQVRAHLAGRRFTEAAELAFDSLKPSRFRHELQKRLGGPPGPNVDLSVVEALWRLEPPVVITTNYDAVLRWPFAGAGARPYQPVRQPPRVVHNDDRALLLDLADLAAGDLPSIWHLHGTLERPDTIVLTEAQYARLYGQGSDQAKQYAFALEKLRDFIASRTLLFIGFSLDDPFVRAQLEYVLDVTGRQGELPFLLAKKGQKDAAALLAQHVQVLEFDDYGPPLVRLLGEMADEAFGPVRFTMSMPSALVGLVDDLQRQLRKMALAPAVVGRAFNRWRLPVHEPVPLGGDGVMLALQASATLANAMRQGDGHFPLLEFARELLPYAKSHRVALEQWIAAASQSLGVDAADVARLHAGGFAPPAGVSGGEYYVLLRLEDAGADTWRGQAWLFDGSEPWKMFPDDQLWGRADLPALVYELLDRIEALELPPAQTTIGFMVPRGLLVEAIDRLEPALEFMAASPIGVTYPVTVRPVERLQFSRNLRRLAMTWDALKRTAPSTWTLVDRSPAPKVEEAWWLLPADATRELVASLQQQGIVCAALATPPPSKAPPEGDLFNCVLQAAVPAVLWLRQPAEDLATARADVTALLGDTSGPLPQRVWRLRQSASAQGDANHPGHCLVLLWDDADRMPPDHELANRAVVPRS